MAKIILSMDKAWFDRNAEKFLKEGESIGYEKPTFWLEINCKQSNLETFEGKINLDYEPNTGSPNFSASVSIPLTKDFYETISEILVKRINKFVQELQNLKGFLEE